MWSELCLDPVQVKSLAKVLEEVPDPRDPKGRLYGLAPILTMAVCAMLCGARSVYAVAQWGRDHGPKMARALGFGRPRTPCTSTLHYVFQKLDEDALETVLSQWFQEQGFAPGEAVAIDGKSLRGIHGEELPGVHPTDVCLVALYVHTIGCVMAQKGGSEKTMES